MDNKLKIKQFRDKINGVIETLIYELFKVQPDEYIEWMVNWLNTKGKELQKKQAMNVPPPKTPVVYHVSSDEGEDDEVHEVHEIEGKKDKQSRSAVSAEVFGVYNKKEDFKPRVIPKSEAQKQQIQEKLLKSFMFQALDKDDRSIVIDAMEIKEYKNEDWIIRQGEDGNELYVVDSGELKCYRSPSKDAEPIHIRTYGPGGSFGELALLYNAPRAASIQSVGESVLFALDRATFNNIVKEATIKRRERYENVLAKVELLKQMEPYERMQICDALKEAHFNPDEWVIREGEEGNTFYMVEKGQLSVEKSDQNGEPLPPLSEGDYFGELALMEQCPRQASIKAITEVKLVYLDKMAFNRLLGPVEKILKRHAEGYKRSKKE